MAEWRFWTDEVPRPGWANMSIDMALLDRAEHQGESWLRLYRWDPCCLSFGRHEPALQRYDVERIRALGLETVRRATGGRAVWHDREVTYAVTSPSSRFASLRAAYFEIHRLLAEALSALGMAVSLAPRTTTPALDAGACFSQAVGGEVLVNGRKVVGSAQLRRGSALLQHGSILLHDDQHRVSGLLRGSNGLGSTAEKVSDALAALEPGRVAAAVAGSARRRWGPVTEPSTELSQVLQGAGQYHPRFRSDAWTWGR